jgi:hypothetical protein
MVVMMVVVRIRQNADMNPRHHVVMMMVVVMAHTDNHLGQLF